MAVVINGSGTVTGLAVGGLPDGTVDAGTLADDAVGLAQMASGTDGNLITYDASGDPAAVAVGTSGQVLTSNGAGAAPTMQAGGKVLQVVTGEEATERGSSTTTWADTGLDASITPSSSSNTILVIFNVSGVGKETGNTSTRIRTVYNVNGGEYTGSKLFGYRNAMTGSGAKNNIGSVSGCYSISPATTNIVNVKAQFASNSGVSNAQVQENNVSSTITLMEISA